MNTQGQAVCRHCNRAIVLLIDRWIHAATGNSACSSGGTEAEPR